MALRLNNVLLIFVFLLFCNTLKAQDNSSLIVKHFLIDLSKVEDSVSLKKNLHISNHTSGLGLLELKKIVRDIDFSKNTIFSSTKINEHTDNVSVKIAENTDLLIKVSDNVIQSIIGINIEERETIIYYRKE
ncbi:hypothetical protein [Sphingobacterium siyangense]|uniref:hypothetical protein n=1 Tax=Sphingobacterium siyangense TaxID=459529 RepID=UPI003019FADC